MQIVIDIPEETYKYYDMLSKKGEVLGYAERTIMRGTPLPEHHGRIIDESKINKLERYARSSAYEHITYFTTKTDAPTIIEGSDSE